MLREGLEFSYKKRVEFALAERKGWASPRKGVNLSRGSEVGECQNATGWWGDTGMVKTKGSYK